MLDCLRLEVSGRTYEENCGRAHDTYHCRLCIPHRNARDINAAARRDPDLHADGDAYADANAYVDPYAHPDSAPHADPDADTVPGATRRGDRRSFSQRGDG